MAEDIELIRDLEIPWLKTMLADSIANLGYPVGMGVSPSEAHLDHAAEFLFARYEKMIGLALAGSGPTQRDRG